MDQATMEQRIKDIQAYVNGLDGALVEKSWFLDFLPERVTTVIDFGCADGALMQHCKDRNAPLGMMLHRGEPLRKACRKSGELKYIGVERDAEFRARCRDRGFECYQALDDVPLPDTKNACLVFSSVLHEVASYGSLEALWDRLGAGYGRVWPSYIAIRDMAPGGYDGFSHDAYCELSGVMHRSGRGWMLDDYERRWGRIETGESALHFLLKYRYEANWDREVGENYFAADPATLHRLYRKSGYRATWSERSALHYLQQRWAEDFGFTADKTTALESFLLFATTHFRLFLEDDSGA